MPLLVMKFGGTSVASLDRIRRVRIPNSFETSLLWSPDSKKLAFRASIDGRSGLYTIEFPDKLTPKLMTSSVGGGARWLKDGNQIVWLRNGQPAALGAGRGAPGGPHHGQPGGQAHQGRRRRGPGRFRP